MARNLDSSLSAALSSPLISPVVLAALTFKSGVMYVWSGVGDFVFNGNTYIGVGQLGKISAISEGSDVKADGMELTLSGIGLSPFTINNPPPSGITPPVTIPVGQFVAWAYPTEVNPGVLAANGTAGGTLTEGAASVSFGQPGAVRSSEITWSNFKMPPLPADAVITAIWPVLFVDYENLGYSNGGLITLSDGGTSPPFAKQLTTTGSIGIDPALLNSSDSTIGFYTANSLMGAHGYSINGHSPACAIYYTSANNAASLVNEAMNDFQSGAPAKVWFGLMSDGALIGNPYLVFSGQVDQPIIDMSTQTASITLALENRLSNLLRPTARRYTAADQHLKYPDDIGFSWVETLNDIALLISAMVQ